MGIFSGSVWTDTFIFFLRVSAALAVALMAAPYEKTLGVALSASMPRRSLSASGHRAAAVGTPGPWVGPLAFAHAAMAEV